MTRHEVLSDCRTGRTPDATSGHCQPNPTTQPNWSRFGQYFCSASKSISLPLPYIFLPLHKTAPVLERNSPVSINDCSTCVPIHCRRSLTQFNQSSEVYSGNWLTHITRVTHIANKVVDKILNLKFKTQQDKCRYG